MACKVIYTVDSVNKDLIGERFASRVAVARAIEPNTSVTVQELNGSHEGWYRQISRTNIKYTVSIPQMDY